MMKKITTFITTILVLGLLLAGCGSRDGEVADAAGSEQNVQSEAPEDTAGTDEPADEAAAAYTLTEGVLAVATEGTYPPYSYHDEEDVLTGYDVEIARAIGAYLGLEVVFTESNWDSLIAGLDVNQYDVVINQVGITEERLEKYIFSDPYTYTRAAGVVAEDDEAIKSLADLDGKKAAQTVTSNWAQIVEENGAELVGTDGFSESVELVLAGRADVTVNDDITFYDYITQKPDAGVKLGFVSDEVSENGVILKQGKEALRDRINEALKGLAENGTLSEISETYFGTNVSVK